jgi:DNA-binding NarL/FixJ family response regulator
MNWLSIISRFRLLSFLPWFACTSSDHEPSFTKKSDTLDFGLTKRELNVISLIATGATNREIAEKLFVSEGTVKNHVSNILNKLGLRDRIQAAIFAIEHNLDHHPDGYE